MTYILFVGSPIFGSILGKSLISRSTKSSLKNMNRLSGKKETKKKKERKESGDKKKSLVLL
jgi:hypothetical protein